MTAPARFAPTKREKKAIDARIDRLYRESCQGVEISIFDIQGVFDAGYAAIAKGATDDDSLRAAIVAFVQTIRKN